jgi:hypothetical protein
VATPDERFHPCAHSRGRTGEALERAAFYPALCRRRGFARRLVVGASTASILSHRPTYPSFWRLETLMMPRVVYSLTFALASAAVAMKYVGASGGAFVRPRRTPCDDEGEGRWPVTFTGSMSA